MVTSKTNAYPHGHKYKINIIIDPDQLESLEALVAKRRTSRAALIREAIDLYLASKGVIEPVVPSVAA